MNSICITTHSEEVKPGCIFVAIKGTNFDGHDFVREALDKGALKVYVERDVGLGDPRIVKVENTRKVLGELANEFYGRPSEKLKLIGVTGTNGKTTSTHIMEAILNEGGINAGLIGTVYYRLKDKIYEVEGRTTPDPLKWHSTLKRMLEDGAKAVVSEVSSHALDQYRVWGSRFFLVGFTNLSRDHLDYHGDMESYFKAKLKLFTEYTYEYALVNTDDPYGRRILEVIGKKALSYGKEGRLRILDFKTGFEGSILKVSYEGKVYQFRSNLVGEFQAYNLSLGILSGFVSGISQESMERALEKVYVPGRFEVYRGDGFLVVVDYAHTPDALEKVLRTAKGLCKNRLICVFGAGGNRDKSKRPLMGKAAQNYADVIVLTSDNPRFEEPMDIIRDILEGIEKRHKVLVEEDRKKAIWTALSIAREGDIVLIAGKGHEDYQEIKGVWYPFKDSDVVKEWLNVRL